MIDFKNMELSDLLACRGELIDQRGKISTDSEGRNLTATEVQTLEGIRSDLARVQLELDAREARNTKSTGVTAKDGTTLMQLLRHAAGVERSEGASRIFDEGATQMRAAGVSYAGGSNAFVIPTHSRSLLTAKGEPGTTLIDTDRHGILAPLESELILNKLGASYSSGLKGNVEFVKGSSATAEWAGENANAHESTVTFDTLKFAPKRLTTSISISRMLLVQDTLGAEEYIKNQLLRAIQTKLESTILGVAAGTADKPAGLLNGTISNKGAASYERVIDIITELSKANALDDTAKFATTPVGLSALAKTPINSSQAYGYLIPPMGNTLAGYNIMTSANAAQVGGEEPLLFARWSDLFIGQWGGISVTYDNITGAKNDIIHFIVQSYWDAGFIRPESLIRATVTGTPTGVAGK